MADKSAIEWTDATFNPWWGCAKVSPGCDNCYAERDAGRHYPGRVLWGVDAERRTFGEKHWNEPLRWERRAIRENRRLRVFCASMADVFDKNAPARNELWGLIAATPHLDWLILTKRIGNVPRMLPIDWGDGYPNVWLGISVVNQEEADRDIPKLIELPARVRFLSCEPLLGRIDLCAQFGMWWNQTMDCWEGTGQHINRDSWGRPRIDWVIVGGESGHKARPMEFRWAQSLRDQCLAAKAAFFFKQGSQANWEHFKDSRYFPPSLRVREWPTP